MADELTDLELGIESPEARRARRRRALAVAAAAGVCVLVAAPFAFTRYRTHVAEASVADVGACLLGDYRPQRETLRARLAYVERATRAVPPGGARSQWPWACEPQIDAAARSWAVRALAPGFAAAASSMHSEWVRSRAVFSGGPFDRLGDPAALWESTGALGRAYASRGPTARYAWSGPTPDAPPPLIGPETYAVPRREGERTALLDEGVEPAFGGALSVRSGEALCRVEVSAPAGAAPSAAIDCRNTGAIAEGPRPERALVATGTEPAAALRVRACRAGTVTWGALTARPERSEANEFAVRSDDRWEVFRIDASGAVERGMFVEMPSPDPDGRAFRGPVTLTCAERELRLGWSWGWSALGGAPPELELDVARCAVGAGCARRARSINAGNRPSRDELREVIEELPRWSLAAPVVVDIGAAVVLVGSRWGVTEARVGPFEQVEQRPARVLVDRGVARDALGPVLRWESLQAVGRPGYALLSFAESSGVRLAVVSASGAAAATERRD